MLISTAKTDLNHYTRITATIISLLDIILSIWDYSTEQVSINPVMIKLPELDGLGESSLIIISVIHMVHSIDQWLRKPDK